MAIPKTTSKLLASLPERMRAKLAAQAFKKGTVITCPNCNAPIAEAAEDIGPQQRRSFWRFVMLQDGHEPDTPLNCAVCGEAFVDDDGRFHTGAGWQ